MDWNQLYPKLHRPELAEIAAYIASPLWDELCAHLEERYGVLPQVEHSVCSGAPGWNVKYKKGSRALCTLYPAPGYFTALVSVGSHEAMEAELLLCTCTQEVQTLYRNTRVFNGGRWLMLEVRTPEVLSDLEQLVALRVKKRK